jgi:hypothetical protein
MVAASAKRLGIPARFRFALDEPHLSRTGRVRGFRVSAGGLATPAALYDQRTTQIGNRLGAYMLHAASPVGAEMIVAQAVEIRIYDGFQPSLQHRPLRGIDLDFEDGELNTLTEVATRLGNTPEPLRAARLGGGHVVGHKQHHTRHPYFQNQGG